MQSQFDAHTLGSLTTAARNPITGKIALGTTTGIVFQYDMERDLLDARVLRDLQGNLTNTIAWSPNGIFLASAHRQGYVGVWHAASGKGVLIGQVDKTNCYALSWSRGGAFLVIPCVGKQELVVYPASEFTLGNYLESGQVFQMAKAEAVFKWKGGKSNLAIGNFSPDDLHFAFTGGDTTIHVVNTANWQIEYKVKMPVRPALMHWVRNDQMIVSGPPEKGAQPGEDLLLLVEMPTGKVLISKTCPTILLLRGNEQEGLIFLLQEVSGKDHLGFRVFDVKSLQPIGEITPNVPDVCDMTFLPSQKKVCIVTRTSLVLGDWNGKDGSHYEQAFSILAPRQQVNQREKVSSPVAPSSVSKTIGQKETLFGLKDLDIKSLIAISADGSRRVVIPGLDPEIAKKWVGRSRWEHFVVARTSLSDIGLTGELLQIAAVLKALEEPFDLKAAISLLTGDRGRLTNDDAQKLLFLLFKHGIIVIA